MVSPPSLHRRARYPDLIIHTSGEITIRFPAMGSKTSRHKTSTRKISVRKGASPENRCSQDRGSQNSSVQCRRREDRGPKTPERGGEATAVLLRARQLLAVERHWGKGSFARSWLDIPGPARSVLAQRYCALGAIMRAGRELGLPTEAACKALELQTGVPIADWNDDRLRTHSEVTAAFDAAILNFAAA